MYRNILKKDLKRKKAMNAILLVFVILATMFVSSSVNNIISVTTALDSYLELANAPDYLGLTMDKAMQIDVAEILDSAESIDHYTAEKMLFLSADNLSFGEEEKKAEGGTLILQSDKDLSMNYFLPDESVLQTVESGEMYVSVTLADKVGLETGDKITLNIAGVTREFTMAGTIKDAVFGASITSIYRFVISGADFDSILANEETWACGGNIYYIHTSDLAAAQEEIAEVIKNFSFDADRADMNFYYILDMVVVGLLLVVSVILIAIAFVVLRFTISFTLSEEFREIGVMKAIGIPNSKIRGLYLVKYAAISVVGAAIGLILSFPFGDMLISATSTSIIMGSSDPFFVNILCALVVIGVILLFCYRCTRKVKKMSPIDAIRNGQSGERFRKKSLMSLGRSKLPASSFLSLNDIVSNPKRFGIVTLTFVLCMSLVLMMSNIVYTMNSGSLYSAFGYAKLHVAMEENSTDQYFIEGGREKVAEDLAEMEAFLAENGMDANCSRTMILSLPVAYGDQEINLSVIQTIGEDPDAFEYTEGTAPQNVDEIAITKLAADKLGVGIGDTVTAKTVDGDREYIITAFYQSMMQSGVSARIHPDEQINYVQAMGSTGVMIRFHDDPAAEEVVRRVERLKELYPDVRVIKTCAEAVADSLTVVPAMEAVKLLVTILTIVLTALITVLMERSFIAKEKGQIALLKAIGTRNSKIYAYHVLRFVYVGIIAVILGELVAMPMTKVSFDLVFNMMGLQNGVTYLSDPLEAYLILPGIVLATTALSAFLTALYTRKIKSSDTANIE